jgi:hypothetical protein
MKSKTSQLLFSYWNEVRRDRLAPRRFEIEPSRITPLLSETFILERLDSDSYRYRLAGTRICEQFDAELRGTNFLDGWSAEDRITLARQMQASAQQGGVVVATFETLSFGALAGTYECLLLPLLHTREHVDRFLGAMTQLSTGAAASHAETSEPIRITGRRLAGIELIWPDGKPHSVVSSLNRQVPFLPHVRNARIVRSDRRQFRVYEGGLGKPGPKDL